ncbi:CaiB/BaiF CoA transferase family protein [Lentibacter sp. XHP0401]|uniref:CaiB/BaiF CoA transferase family protein n=1 Tax=Lentibacter sp. XHP0401 TaxID=2984334 RepID=UPI0021E885EA|nr:CaiB/BaiF CoA-transferase family protein [Lentibacter sp. XHP0401]MCV2893772.1 CoA transferase [Lentibacter sp. XHP0401]
MGALSGVRIVEVEGLGPAPFAGMLLADMGADVIVVHRKGGTPAPGMPQRSVLDRGKRSIELNLKDEGDKAVFLKLVGRVDALIEGFRPGVMERLGLGPEACHAVNPKLVFGRMTGWGQSGPLAHAAGHDLNYIAMSGALWYAGAPEAAPLTPATLVGDIGGGAMYLVSGVLAGILQARASGQGTVVDAAIYDGSAHMMNLVMALRQSGGMPEARGQGLLDGPHWSRTYECACGGYLSVQSLEPQFYAEFLRLLKLEGDEDFQRQYDKALWPELTGRLAAIFKTRSRDDWAALFLGTDACAAPVLSPDEAARHEMNGARSTWAKVNGVLQAAPAPRFEGQGGWEPVEPPARGADTAAILKELED